MTECEDYSCRYDRDIISYTYIIMNSNELAYCFT